MPQFTYKALNITGSVIKGTMEASNELALVKTLRENGYYPVSINVSKLPANIKIHFSGGIKLKDISLFCRQFATIINAGLTIVEALNILSQQVENKRLKNIINKTLEEVQKGKTLSESMRQFKEFPPLLTNMIGAGEASGKLEEVLLRMSAFYEKENRIREKIKSALMYPMVLSIVAIGVVFLLVTTVLPVFAGVFESLKIELPLTTRILMWLSSCFERYWYIIISSAIIIGYCIKLYIGSGKGRYMYHRLLLKLPVIGKINRKVLTSRFSGILSVLLSSGIPVLQAMEIMKDTITNAVVEEGIEICKDDIKSGRGLSHSIKSIGVFPPMLTEMIAIGEETGTLDNMLNKTSQFYDEEVDILTSRLTTIIEPVIIVLLSVVVGFIIISVVVPMFDIYSHMS